jgi:hypothetical protein
LIEKEIEPRLGHYRERRFFERPGMFQGNTLNQQLFSREEFLDGMNVFLFRMEEIFSAIEFNIFNEFDLIFVFAIPSGFRIWCSSGYEGIQQRISLETFILDDIKT